MYQGSVQRETLTLPVPIRLKAVRAALSMTAGAYQTGLVSYFTHRDLFPSLVKVRVPNIYEYYE